MPPPACQAYTICTIMSQQGLLQLYLPKSVGSFDLVTIKYFNFVSTIFLNLIIRLRLTNDLDEVSRLAELEDSAVAVAVGDEEELAPFGHGH